MKELRFLFAVWKTTLLGAMDFRVSFVMQVFGMVINNLLYIAFWPVFFSHINNLRGWTLEDMLMVNAVVAMAWGLGVVLFGNFRYLSEVIAGGRLDYYLSLPRPVLPHVLASRTVISGWGDVAFGVVCFFLVGQPDLWSALRFIIASLASMLVAISFLVLVNSLTFWVGNASALGGLGINALLTFSMYPLTIFDPTAKFFLIIGVPALLVGAFPAGFVRVFSWEGLGQLALSALAFGAAAVWVFYRGLRRYESGSAFQSEV